MPEKSSRLLSLDALRRFTIAAMIVVNTPGSWETIYPPLRHAPWHGLTPTDLIFPWFLFIVGVSIALAYGKPRGDGKDSRRLHRKILVRAAKILAVGLFLNLWPEFAFGELRVAGVLQRIAVVFGVVALLFLHLRWRAFAGLAATLLVGYGALLAWMPVPRDAVIESALNSGRVERAWGEIVDVQITAAGPDHIAPNVEPGTNLAAWLDRQCLPGRFYETTWDPEGLLSTVPAMATALLGVLTGLFLLRQSDLRCRVLALGAGGIALLAVGYGWAAVLPLNKNLWTSSFVLVSAGWALLGFAFLLGLIDGRGLRRWAFPGLVFGANAITAYVLADMLTTITHRAWWGDTSLRDGLMRGLTTTGASPELASLLFALAFAAVVFLPILVLYRRQIFIRL